MNAKPQPILRALVFAWLMVTFAGLPSNAAEAPDAAFDAANRLFEQGKYRDAATAYEIILESGQSSPALRYNLGNAWFKAGEIGRAIASYRRAVEIAPRDPDIAANLAFARAAVPGATPPKTSWFSRLVSRLTLNEWATGAGLALWLWMAVLVWRQRGEESGPIARRLTVASAVATALLAGLLLSAWLQQTSQRWVVVTADDAVLRHGPLDESPSLQTLHDGQELQVRDEKDGWLLVTGAARGQGWLKRDHVLAVR
jgi:tetratricopeptide (TPR) repeat protein